MIERRAHLQRLRDLLGQFPVVGLIGARQVGKTTLAKAVAAGARSDVALPQDDSSSRFLRNRRFWHKVDVIQPGKVVGWILETEEGSSRIKR